MFILLLGNYHPKTGCTDSFLPPLLWASKAQELSFQLCIPNAQTPKIFEPPQKIYSPLYVVLNKSVWYLQINSKWNRMLPLEGLIL